MTSFEYIFADGRREKVEASYYKKERNPKSNADEYVFYDDSESVVKIVPVLWLDYNGSPREV